MGVFKGSLLMAWGMTAVRERARLRAARAPLIGVETIARRDGLLGATAPGSDRLGGLQSHSPTQAQMDAISEMVWARDAGHFRPSRAGGRV